MNRIAEPAQSPAHDSRWGTICMLVSIVCFSVNSLTLKSLADSNVSPWVALLFRASVGMAIVATALRADKRVDFRRAMADRMLATRGLLGVLGTVAYYFTIPELGPGKATLISNTYVVIAALMAVWVFQESFGAGKLIGNALALTGLMMLVASPAQLAQFGWYEAWAVLGALAAAGTVIVIRQLTRTQSTGAIYASQCIYVLAGCLPFALYEMQQHSIGLGSVTVLVLAGVSATIGQLAMTEGFRHLTVAVGGAFQICVPVLIAAGGVYFFGETFTAGQLVGAVLILAGCYWVTVMR
ncbi:MAG: DMT family transporter [Aureliella sp.]